MQLSCKLLKSDQFNIHQNQLDVTFHILKTLINADTENLKNATATYFGFRLSRIHGDRHVGNLTLACRETNSKRLTKNFLQNTFIDCFLGGGQQGM